jgi:hypothetical protein
VADDVSENLLLATYFRFAGVSRVSDSPREILIRSAVRGGVHFS